MALFLMGPTAAGKTALALALAERFPCEIVSVDSAMVYRRLDIGTGKPDRATLRRFPHRLIDIREPWEPYSAARFRHDAEREMAEIRATGRVPLLVGGTGLYFKALRDGLSRLPPADAKVRGEIERCAARIGWPALHQRLAAIDARAAARIHPHDPQRIQRALEIYELTGRSITESWDAGPPSGLDLPVRAAILSPADRSLLHRRIERRFSRMLALGLVEEVEALRAEPCIRGDLPSLRAVGYRQVWAYLDGALDYSEMKLKACAATRQLARRQLTWLRSEPTATWFDAGRETVREELFRFTEAALAGPR